MRAGRQTRRSHSALLAALSIGLLAAVADGQAAPPVAPNNSLTFEVTDGNCSPQSVTSVAGRTVVAVKMTSTKPQHVALSTAGPNKKYLFEHAQVGSSERWTTMIYLPAGSYELMSSLNGDKCAVTVN
jgi:hypothetical protein